jgi:hypothetical protein
MFGYPLSQVRDRALGKESAERSHVGQVALLRIVVLIPSPGELTRSTSRPFGPSHTHVQARSVARRCKDVAANPIGIGD